MLDTILKNFSPYDFNHDETNEINSLITLDSPAQQPTNDKDNLLLIIVNSTLLGPKRGDPRVKNLLDTLEVFRSDLINDGYKPRFIEADIYSGPRHQDGLIVLAIRKFFQEVKKSYPFFKGAIFIGSFPEAFLVRTYPWRKHAGYDENGVVINGHRIEGKDYLRIWPEVIADRSDIVLCDLEGKWDEIYHEKQTTLPSLMAVPERYNQKDWPEYGSISVIDIQEPENFDPRRQLFEVNSCNDKFEDFFHINDGQFLISQVNIKKQLAFKDILLLQTQLEILEERNLEVSQEDLKNPNPIATPEIIVSRIDARHIAVVPNPTYLGDHKESLLDKYGNPQEIRAKQVNWNALFIHDAELEYKLIIECFERNHKHREKKPVNSTVDAIAGPDFTQMQILNDISLFANPKTVPPDGACLSEYVNWLDEPALVRGITGHATSLVFKFSQVPKYDLDRIEAEWSKYLRSDDHKMKNVFLWQEMVAPLKQECLRLEVLLGSNPERWYWDEANRKLCPGWKNTNGEATMHLHKAFWKKHRSVLSQGRFYISNGCNANSPIFGNILPYSNELYGVEQIAESLLFYAGGLAMISRAKTFNDLPSHIAVILFSQHRRFGEIWSENFNSDKLDGSLDSVDNGIQRKRSYFWGLIGDWTLQPDN